MFIFVEFQCVSFICFMSFCLKPTMLLSNNTKVYYLYSILHKKRERKDFSFLSRYINELLISQVLGLVHSHPFRE